MKWPYLNCLKWSSGWGKVPPLYWIWVSYVLSIEKVCFRGKNSSDPRKNLLDTSIANNPFVYLLHSVRKSLNMSHLSFSILAFSTIFCPIKIDLSGNTVWPQALDFQKLAKLAIFGIFDELLSTQNVNKARFARNVECDFLAIFKHCAFKTKTKKILPMNLF